MRKVLAAEFFNRDTKIVAEELLGKFLVRKMNGKELAAMVTETEVYDGPHDLASHASRGRTPRTQVMFGHPGNFYVYLCYGVHEMLNVVTREKEYPGAVLIRKAILDTGVPLGGPGKLTKSLNINRALNDKLAGKASGLWFEDRGINIPASRIQKLPRIGVAYAGPIWSVKKLRFALT
ncbi:DNA-3-methyladenine glycosylase [Candidatus Parcubacteria bacterium]|nr:DNA-3-methyladenine glycosylase [Candidatus Parcubacteria bacterium]